MTGSSLTKLFIPMLILSMSFLTSCSDEKPSESNSLISSNIGKGVELNSSEAKVVAELVKYITPLKGTSPSLGTSDLTGLDKFASATVIGLGEANHGSKDLFEIKHRLFKYFVEKHGFRIFGFEADMGECIYIDRFITKSNGTIKDVMNKMYFWTWKTEEVKNLILWMKEYNQGKSEANKIHLFGVDCQTTQYNKDLILNYLNNYDRSCPDYIKRILDAVHIRLNQSPIGIDINVRSEMGAKCDSVLTYFEENKNRLIDGSGKFEYDIISRLLIQTKQCLDIKTLPSNNTRDYYMAENTLWLTSLLGNPTKVVSWAHNGHVARDELLRTQGGYLSSALGVNYKVICTSFNLGSFRAYSLDALSGSTRELTVQNITRLPLRSSYNYIFQAAVPKDFILINSDIPSSGPLNSWYNTSRDYISIGSTFNIDVYQTCYKKGSLVHLCDAVIHIQKVSSAVAYK